MKHLEKEFKSFLGLLLLFAIALPTQGQITQRGDSTDGILMDSVEVSLLTCSPHEEVYSLYGHSALRWHDLHNQRDIAFNWGVFSFDKPYFVLRFVFGLTDYELGPYPYPLFEQEYRQVGSCVTEQVLNLTSTEKQAVWEALMENYLPENRIYRYNYFRDNCSTRPRDLIEHCIMGRIEYAERKDFTPSFREMIHECTRNHPWAAFGNDMLLGIGADQPTTRQQQEFLPANLMYDFDHATIYSDGQYRPLVKERRIAVKPGVQVIDDDFPLSPKECALLILTAALVICFVEWHRHQLLRYWDALLMLFQGLVGCLLFVMLFSQHPTTSTNLQLLLFNPVALAFIRPVIKGHRTRWWHIQSILIGAYLAASLLQQFPDGMIIVALSLLTRVIIRYVVKK